jgi:hypothetical protein
MSNPDTLASRYANLVSDKGLDFMSSLVRGRLSVALTPPASSAETSVSTQQRRRPFLLGAGSQTRGRHKADVLQATRSL